MTDLTTLIAKTIRDADRSWFNEDYTKQAAAVLNTLRAKGYEIVPREASAELVTYAVDNMPFGRMKPDDLIRELYATIIGAAKVSR